MNKSWYERGMTAAPPTHLRQGPSKAGSVHLSASRGLANCSCNTSARAHEPRRFGIKDSHNLDVSLHVSHCLIREASNPTSESACQLHALERALDETPDMLRNTRTP